MTRRFVPWRKNWTPEARQAARDRSLVHPEWGESGRRAFIEKYPEFVAAYRLAMENPQWRCYECRKDCPL